MKAPRASSGSLAGILLAGLALAAAGGVCGWIYLRRTSLADHERSAVDGLHTLAAAEADFRANDRDGNRIQDFWTGDVGGLYYLGTPVGPGRTESMRLIPAVLARADAGRKGAVPYRGYLFVAMDTDEEGEPYRKVTDERTGGKPERNTSKFAFCAYPAEYGFTGRATYVINEGNTIFKIDSGGKPVLKWPTDPELRRSYSKFD
jgi:hypothetical protein